MQMYKGGVAAATMMLAAGLLTAWPAPAHAQDARLRVSFGAATTTGTPDSQVALTGGIGYRFSQRLSFDVELTGFDASNDRGGPIRIAQSDGVGVLGFGGQRPRSFLGGAGFQQIVAPSIYPPIRGNADGQTILATVGLRYEFPVQTGRLLPYVTGGLGAARTDRTVQYSIPILNPGPVRGGATAPIRQGSETITHTSLAGSLGVGASLRVFKQLSLDVDARYFHLDSDRTLGRLGGGVSYRF